MSHGVAALRALRRAGMVRAAAHFGPLRLNLTDDGYYVCAHFNATEYPVAGAFTFTLICDHKD